jgi:isopenicillin-N N-acyltransferase-like protein
MNFLTLSGSPFDRGRAYGEALRGEIVEQVQFFRGLILNQAHLDPDDFFAHLLTLGWREAAEVWTPHLLDEVRGIAEGAKLPFADLFAWQCAQEVFWYMPQYLQSSSGPTAGCSVVADAGDDVHPTILAQNADTIPFWHQHQTLLRILPASDEEPEQLIMTYPGLIGPYGLNSAGIGICVNALFHNLNNSTQGLPTPLLTRAVLSKRTFAEAVSFIQEVPHASGNTLTVGGPGSVVAFEVSENAVVPFMLSDTPYRTCHTNHVLVSDDFQPNASRDSHPNSADRMAMLIEGLADIPDHLTVDDVKGLLSSHGARAQLCRHEDDAWGSMTTYAMIMELDGTPRLHVSFGPPCREPFQTFDFAAPPAPEV